MQHHRNHSQLVLLFCLVVILGINIGFGFSHTISNFLTGSPEIAIDRKILDFGVLPEGVETSQIVKITNSGNSDLVITNLRMGCGCTFAKIRSDDPIAPGDSTTLEVSLKMPPGVAPTGTSVNVYVFSNAVNQQVTTITAKAQPAKVSIAVPDFIDFGRISVRDRLPIVREFVLHRTRDEEVDVSRDFTIELPKDCDYVAAKLVVNSGRASRYSLSLLETAPVGDICLDLKYHHLPTGLRGKVRVRGQILGDYLCSPQMVMLNRSYPGDKPVSKLVQISRTSQTDGAVAPSQVAVAPSQVFVDSVFVSEPLNKLVTCSTSSTESGIEARITAVPGYVLGSWPDKSFLGRIVFHLTDSDGRSEVLNLPIDVAVPTRLTRIRDRVK